MGALVLGYKVSKIFCNFVVMDVNIEETWKERLSGEFRKPYFSVLAERVREEYSKVLVFPPGRLIFSAFEKTPYDEVKVVIVGQDPYHGEGQANGMAFSVGDGVALPPSLINIFKEVEAETGSAMPRNGDLSRWATQGVLLLNSSLTVRAHEARSHAGLGWQEFTDAVIRELNVGREHLVFMLWGSDAIRKGRGIDRNRHLVLTSPHPSPLSAYRGFFGNGHFVAANRYLENNGIAPIKW